MEHICLEAMEINIRKSEVRACTGVGKEGPLSAHDAHDLGKARALLAAYANARKVDAAVTELVQKKGLFIVLPNLADCIDIGFGGKGLKIDRHVRNATAHRAFYRADLGQLANGRVRTDLVDFIYQDTSCDCNSCHISLRQGREDLPAPRGRRAYRGWWG